MSRQQLPVKLTVKVTLVKNCYDFERVGCNALKLDSMRSPEHRVGNVIIPE